MKYSTTSFVLFVHVTVKAVALMPKSVPIQTHRTEEFENALKSAQDVNINPLWLESFLSPFATKCYVIVRNFFNLDFTQTSIPLLTKYFEPHLPGHSDLSKNNSSFG